MTLGPIQFMAKDEPLKPLVIGSKFSELGERVSSVRKQLSHRIADTFRDAAVVAMGKLLIEFVN